MTTVIEKDPTSKIAKPVTVAEAVEDARSLMYPEGWFQVSYSDELEPGQVKKLHYFGQELVLFRTESGKAQLMDAYCAHLGAHLGVGGVVAGENIRCAFHAWEYGTDGLCKKIPYSDRIPARGALVKTWPTVERSGIVLAWYSENDNPPSWDPPELPGYGTPGWTADYFLRKEYTVRISAHEIVENVADAAHAKFVHGSPEIPFATFAFEGHTFNAEFKNDLPTIGGKTTNIFTAHGLYNTVNLSTGHGSKAFFTNYTPIDRDNLHVHFSIVAALNTPEDPTGEISMHSARGSLLEFEKDIPIWENKIFRKIPLLVKDDGPIGRFRVWARQFF